MARYITLNDLTVIFADILQIITDKYVKNDLTIPAKVLALKDEACDIIGKAADEQRKSVLAEYGRRLAEIHECIKGISKNLV